MVRSVTRQYSKFWTGCLHITATKVMARRPGAFVDLSSKPEIPMKRMNSQCHDLSGWGRLPGYDGDFKRLLGQVSGQAVPAWMTLRLAVAENHRRQTSFGQAWTGAEARGRPR